MTDRRRLVVVDTETSGLRAEDVAVEVAWCDMTTGEHGRFVPPHNVAWVLKYGESVALEMNGYRERLQDALQDDGTEALRLFRALRGQTLTGSNPAFDADHLEYVFGSVPNGMFWDADRAAAPNPLRPWHHRMLDLSSYAAGALGLDTLPGLASVCEQLGIDPPDHTAEGDVRATVLCVTKISHLSMTAARSRALLQF